ncbi:MAG: 4Fe-4S binding protein [Firmicutes bacterium]|nr:4Fe-4S binding protein [Bacillota bacterium]
MARIITEECIGCGSCVGECPVNAIVEGTPIFKIVESDCIDCGACDPSCPVGAIKEK